MTRVTMLSDVEQRQRAEAVLRGNDRGGYTIPSPRLYPFQWNWDSAVVALGWMTFDEQRAWREFERLCEGQWENGMIPHVIFHAPSDTYFPGPAEWGVTHEPPTSSISQPPLAASIVRLMHARARDRPAADSAIRRLLPPLLAWHRWWYRDRDLDGSGRVVTLHPWESGLDNSPAWDDPLVAVPKTARAYVRRDTHWVDASKRPHQHDYDRYVYLLDFFREANFAPDFLYRECPYRVVDFGLNAILLRATVDLMALCVLVDDRKSADELRGLATRARKALAELWSNPISRFVSLDHCTGKTLEARTHSTFLAWYGGLIESSETDAKLLGELRNWLARAPHSLASTHPDAAEFEAQRYWRGPVWPHLNWLIAVGLSEHGHQAEAENLRTSTRRLLASGGFREYFNPLTGEAYGGDDFSWSAAVSLFW